MKSAAQRAIASTLSSLSIVLLAALAAPAIQAQPAQAARVPAKSADTLPVTATGVSPSAEYLDAQTRWKTDLAAFAAADKQSLPRDDGVLFVGSSTIRLWASLTKDFNQLPVVINRGFGGSTMYDVSLFARDLVVRYKPRHVLVYAGDNDLAAGRSPMQVLEAFAVFSKTVRDELPNVRISYISVKPSPSRESLLPAIRETNDVISAYLKHVPNSEYIDIFTPMMAADGKPRPELFRADRLHLNDDGYRLWQSIIVSHLPTPPKAGAVASSQADSPTPVEQPALAHAAAR